LADSLKVIAMLTMLVDHIGFVFFPEQIIWRIIGRLAFPLFAWGIVQGYNKTASLKRYVLRLLTAALVSQIPYVMLFGVRELNIIFTLLWGLIVVHVWERFSPLLALLLCLPAERFMSYGIFGVFLILLMHVWQDNKNRLVMGVLAATIAYVVFKRVPVQIFCVLALPLILNFQWSVSLPKYFAYLFYPGHLIALIVIRGLLSRL